MTDNIKPEHYRKGEIDLFESWYLTYPFNEYRAIMQAIAERYMRRDKNDRVEDLDKAMYTLQRLKEKEIERAEEKTTVVGSYGGMDYTCITDLLLDLQMDSFEWLARDEDEMLFAFIDEPIKGKMTWRTSKDCEKIQNDNFPEVKWTDDEPTKISKLLASYENGGENGK